MTITVTGPMTSPDTEFKGSDRWIQFGSVRYPYHLRYDAADELAAMLGWLDADLFLLVSDAGLSRDLVARTRRRIIATGTPCIVLRFGGGEQAKDRGETVADEDLRDQRIGGSTGVGGLSPVRPS